MALEVCPVKLMHRVCTLSALVPLAGALLLAGPSAAQAPGPRRPTPAPTPPPATYPALPSEIPAKFTPTNDGFDYVRREVMIPMRDGVKLHTVILVPKGREGGADPPDPHALRRRQAHEPRRERSPRAGPQRLRQRRRDVILEGGYIRVVQDVRGKHGSEGDYVVNRPAARAAEPDARRSRDRHVRHHRLAREERPGEQRQGRHPGHLVRRLPAPDGARRTRTRRSRCRCR